MALPGEFDQPIGDPIPRAFLGETGVLIGTGPSLDEAQIAYVREMRAEGRCRVFTVNNAYMIAGKIDVHVACNHDWWDHYGNDPQLQNLKALKYTWYQYVAEKYGATYVKAIVKDGLSLDRRIVHINHGSGPLALNIAMHFGLSKLILLGHDMKFAKDYNGRARKEGSTPRHYFGEYPKQLQHWPSVQVGKTKPGVLDGLIQAYNKMPPDLEKAGMEVVNCTPESALPTFRMSTLEKEL